MTVAEGGGKRAIMRKFQDVYLPALKANFMLWPAVQILNFRVVPIQFQIVSTSKVPIFHGARTNMRQAVRFYHWYRLDCVPLPHKLC